MKERIYKQAEDMFNKRLTCFLCGQEGHISDQCRYSSNSTVSGTAVRRRVCEVSAHRQHPVSENGRPQYALHT
eukprot:8930776-Pyramimonas_sp.AAC.1